MRRLFSTEAEFWGSNPEPRRPDRFIFSKLLGSFVEKSVGGLRGDNGVRGVGACTARERCRRAGRPVITLMNVNRIGFDGIQFGVGGRDA